MFCGGAVHRTPPESTDVDNLIKAHANINTNDNNNNDMNNIHHVDAECVNHCICIDRDSNNHNHTNTDNNNSTDDTPSSIKESEQRKKNGTCTTKDDPLPTQTTDRAVITSTASTHISFSSSSSGARVRRLSHVVSRAKRLLCHVPRRRLCSLHRTAEALYYWTIAMIAQVAVYDAHRRPSSRCAHHNNSQAGAASVVRQELCEVNTDGTLDQHRMHVHRSVYTHDAGNVEHDADEDSRCNDTHNAAERTPESLHHVARVEKNTPVASVCPSSSLGNPMSCHVPLARLQTSSSSSSSLSNVHRHDTHTEKDDADVSLAALRGERQAQLDYLVMAEEEMQAMTTLLHRILASAVVHNHSNNDHDDNNNNNNNEDIHDGMPHGSSSSSVGSEKRTPHLSSLNRSESSTRISPHEDRAFSSFCLHSVRTSSSSHDGAAPASRDDAFTLQRLRRRLALQTERAESAELQLRRMRARVADAVAAAREARAEQHTLRRRLAQSEALLRRHGRVRGATSACRPCELDKVDACVCAGLSSEANDSRDDIHVPEEESRRAHSRVSEHVPAADAHACVHESNHDATDTTRRACVYPHTAIEERVSPAVDDVNALLWRGSDDAAHALTATAPVEDMTLAQLRHAVYTLRRDCAAMQAAGWRGALQAQALRNRAIAERQRRREMHTVRLRALATLRESMADLLTQYQARQQGRCETEGPRPCVVCDEGRRKSCLHECDRQ